MSISYLYALDVEVMNYAAAWALRELRLHPDLKEVDSIAVRGNSGVLVGGIVSAISKKRLILIRKPGETSHTSQRVEFANEYVSGYRTIYPENYVILDDFTETGATVDCILDHIRDYWANELCLQEYTPECRAVMLYEARKKNLDAEVEYMPNAEGLLRLTRDYKTFDLWSEIRIWQGVGPLHEPESSF